MLPMLSLPMRFMIIAGAKNQVTSKKGYSQA